MSDDLAATLRKARELLMNPTRLDRCPPHLVHPRWVGPDWVLADGSQAGDRVVGCANLCGSALFFRRVTVTVTVNPSG